MIVSSCLARFDTRAPAPITGQVTSSLLLLDELAMGKARLTSRTHFPNVAMHIFVQVHDSPRPLSAHGVPLEFHTAFG